MATGDGDARVFTVPLPTPRIVGTPAAATFALPAAPRLTSNRVLAETEPLADVAALALADGSTRLLASLTFFDPNAPYVRRKTPAPDGRVAPLRALLSVQNLAADGTLVPAEPLSLRARSLSGIDLVPADEGALLVWSAIDEKDPQVFATLLDPTGKKVHQAMITRSTGDVTAVSAAPVSDGFVLSFVDDRNGRPEVFVVKLSDRLARRTGDRPLSAAVGWASQIVSRAHGDQVLVVRTDARGADPGVSDIIVQAVSAKDASSNGEPFRVTSGEGHAHSPVLARSGKGWVLAWLEEDPQKPTEAPKLHIASLHESGHALLSHHEFGTPDGSLPRQVDLDCSDTLCRVVLTTTDEFGRHSLYAGRISDEGQLAFVRLSAAGAGDAAFGLALLPSGVAFAESRGERPAWLRWGQILWAE
jgi:hypothetical protein